MIAPHHFAAILGERIAAAIEEESGHLMMGMAADWADYRHRAGMIAGMRNVERIIQELTEDKE